MSDKPQHQEKIGFFNRYGPLILSLFVLAATAMVCIPGKCQIIGLFMLVSFIGFYIYLAYFSSFSRKLKREGNDAQESAKHFPVDSNHG
jgi:hypothetical protein